MADVGLLLETITAAVTSTSIALAARCTGRGRLFASKKSGWLTVGAGGAIAALSATAAEASSAVTPTSVSTAAQFTLAITLPMTMVAAKVSKKYLQRTQPLTGPSPWLKLFSVGSAVVLDRLDTQMALDKDEWVISDGWNDLDAGDIAECRIRLVGALTRLTRQDDTAKRAEITKLNTAVMRALSDSRKPDSSHDKQEQAIERARQAILRLRGCAYDWGLHRSTDIDLPAEDYTRKD